MNNKIGLFILFAILFSCSGKNQFPPFQFEKVDLNQVQLLEIIPFAEVDSVNRLEKKNVLQNNLEQLVAIENQYFEKNESFNVGEFEGKWQQIQSEKEASDFDFQDLKTWFETTGTLLQITGEAKYAEEMQELLQNNFKYFAADSNKIKDVLEPYLFTKNVDHIHVNLFIPAEISYNHTLHGKVKIVQKTHFPEPGEMTLNFEMENEQYIELFVRIPSWAQGATVTVKNVKYIAPPGGYCQISKKWKNGDTVEIYFPSNKPVAGL